MLSRTILISFPFSSMTVSALCAQLGLTPSSSSTSESLVRPMSGQRIPPVHVVKILLHDDVTAAGKGRILAADHGGVQSRLACGIFRSVDKSKQVTAVEVAKAVDLIRQRNCGPDPCHDQRRQFEAQIHALRPDVEQEVARGGDGVARSRSDLAKRMQFGRPRLPEESIPSLGPERHDAGKIFGRLAKPD